MAAITVDLPAAFAPVQTPSRYKGLYGGRGSGKSHAFATFMILNAVARPGLRAVCLREVQKDLKESAKLLLEDKIGTMGLSSAFDCQRSEIKAPGGGIIIFRGMQDYNAESIKSLEGFDIAWIEEAQTLSERSLELLRPTIRKPGSEIWASWNPRNPSDPVDAFLRGSDPPENAIVIGANFDANPFLPRELEAERQHDERSNRDRYAHIWLGAYEPVAIGAIWDRQTIAAYRRATAPSDLSRIVVAVDPAISAEKGSDEHGIVVCGRGSDGRGYILEDASVRGTPREWSTRAVAMHDKWDADAIVIERNQGGDMCAQTLRSARPSGLRIVEVVATRGKHVRAEPISALYATGRVSHCGTFDRLEDQMCQTTAAGYEGNGSPDRLDALVWGLTELFPGMVRPKAHNGPTVAAGLDHNPYA